MLLFCSHRGLTDPPSDGCPLRDAAMGPARADTVTQTCPLVPCQLPAVHFFKHILAFCLCGVNTGGRKHNFSLLAVGATSCFACLDGGHGLPLPDGAGQGPHSSGVTSGEEAVTELAQAHTASVLASTEKS